MGLLDDAIREHLELKRRHGADPDEVARQENEALGETRRAEFARPEGMEPAGEAASAGPATEPDIEAAAPEDFPVPEFHAGREPAAERDDAAPEDLAERDAPAPRDDLAAPDAPAPRDDLAPPDAPAPRDDLAEPTAEYEVEADAAAAREPFDAGAEEPAAAAPPERARDAGD